MPVAVFRLSSGVLAVNGEDFQSAQNLITRE